MYLPAAEAFVARSAEGGKLGREIFTWKASLDKHWHELRFGPLKTELRDDCLHFEIAVYPGALDPDSFRVELYSDGSEAIRKPMDRGGLQADGGYLYTGCGPAAGIPNNFTPRVVPSHAGASVPLEANQILWQR